MKNLFITFLKYIGWIFITTLLPCLFLLMIMESYYAFFFVPIFYFFASFVLYNDRSNYENSKASIENLKKDFELKSSKITLKEKNISKREDELIVKEKFLKTQEEDLLKRISEEINTATSYITYTHKNVYLITITTDANKEYSLRADVDVSYTKTVLWQNGKNNISFKETYRLKKVYWNNRGYLTFGITDEYELIDNKLKLNDYTTLCDSHGKSYKILFENKLYIDYILDKIKSIDDYVEKENKKANEHKKLQKNVIKEINDIINHRLDYNYLAEFVADYRKILNDRYETQLRKKKRPAIKTADKVSELSKSLRKSEKKYKALMYQMAIYEDIFPWLTEFKEVSPQEIEAIASEQLTSESEQVKLSQWLTKEEYDTLSTAEKYQRALDNYKKAKKTNWQIGVAYERYIGYLYETNGYKTTYFGATKGLNDLGRDLIATKNNEIIVIQCKYWSESKTIHEKHIFQLYGTMFAMSIDSPNKDIKGIFVTSAALSDTAKLYAEKLNIEIQEHSKFDYDYPCIKCNISKRTGEKIYHLPFDQQYDNIEITASLGECYVSTVKEAEELGFRRAFRWHNTE